MTDAFLAWFRATRTSADRFLALAGDLGAAGISVINPVFGEGSLTDIEGDSVPMPVDRIAELVGLAIAPLHVEWWLGDDGMSSLFEPNALEGETQTYHLDGFDSEQTGRLARVVLDEISRHPDETIGLVIDVSGNTAGYDWETFMRYGPTALERLPQTLLARRSLIDASVLGDSRNDFVDLGNGFVCFGNQDDTRGGAACAS